MARPAVATFDGTPMSSMPEYRVWSGMIARCSDPNSTSYRHYGGRGIRVCESWRSSFLAFLADVGHRPSYGHSIDRIDVNGNYEPSNVRWATASEQASNRRPIRLSKVSPIDGREVTAALLAFRSWVESNGVPVLRLAPDFAVGQPTLAKWLRGHFRPEHHHRIRIHRLTGIPVDDWLTDYEFVVAYGLSRSPHPSDS